MNTLRINLHASSVLFCLLSLILFPPLTQAVWDYRNQSLPTLLVGVMSIVVITLVYGRLPRLPWGVLALLSISFIFGLRDLNSLLITAAFFILFYAGYILGFALIRLDENQVRKLVNRAVDIIMVLAAIGLLGFEPKHYTTFPKSVLPFLEPSHFAIASAALFSTSLMISNQKRKLLIVAFLTLVCLQGSLVTILALIMMLCLYFSFDNSKLTFGVYKTGLKGIIILILLGSTLSLAYEKLVSIEGSEYYTERIVNPESNNATVLTYLGDWQRAILSFEQNPVGYGIGQFAEAPIGYFSENLWQIVGYKKHLEDPSFLAPKLIVELGVLGILLLLLFGWFLALVLNSRDQRKTLFVLKVNCVFFLLLDLFIRSIGLVSMVPIYLGLSLYIHLKSSKFPEHQQGRAS